MKNLKKRKGFTLVELIVVIAIIGILASVLIPSISSYIDKAKDSAALQEAKIVETAYNTWVAERSEFTDSDMKSNFKVYLTDLNLLKPGQSIEESAVNFNSDFVFVASNNRRVQFDFDDLTGILSIVVLEVQ